MLNRQLQIRDRNATLICLFPPHSCCKLLLNHTPNCHRAGCSAHIQVIVVMHIDWRIKQPPFSPNYTLRCILCTTRNTLQVHCKVICRLAAKLGDIKVTPMKGKLTAKKCSSPSFWLRWLLTKKQFLWTTISFWHPEWAHKRENSKVETL